MNTQAERAALNAARAAYNAAVAEAQDAKLDPDDTHDLIRYDAAVAQAQAAYDAALAKAQAAYDAHQRLAAIAAIARGCYAGRS
jgi:hypothetical protein